MIAIQLEEPNHIDLSQLDDDGGSSEARQSATRHDGAYGFRTPMIPGAREPGKILQARCGRNSPQACARSSRMATAGNFLPSRNSRKAPPPVEM